MAQAFDRTAALLGEERFGKLLGAHVLVVGLGGVGGAATEVLARSGIRKLTLADGDNFEPTNLNRQLLCTIDVVGRSKAEVASMRVGSIAPQACVKAISQYVNRDTIDEVLDGEYDYCVDAIDDIKNKVLLISECVRRGIPIVSAMGAGNRLDCDFTVTDIYKTKDDPLARKLRHELRACGVEKLDVVCAVKPPIVHSPSPLSVAAPPMVMGAMLANVVVKTLVGM